VGGSAMAATTANATAPSAQGGPSSFWRGLGTLRRGGGVEIAGAIAKPFHNLFRGLGNLITGIFTGNWRQAVSGLFEMTIGVAFPGLGGKGGLLWGDEGFPSSGTKPDIASGGHDLAMSRPGGWKSSSNHFAWIRDSFTGPGREPGPYGQVYRVVGAVGFGIAGTVLWVAGE